MSVLNLYIYLDIRDLDYEQEQQQKSNLNRILCQIIIKKKKRIATEGLKIIIVLQKEKQKAATKCFPLTFFVVA